MPQARTASPLDALLCPEWTSPEFVLKRLIARLYLLLFCLLSLNAALRAQQVVRLSGKTALGTTAAVRPVEVTLPQGGTVDRVSVVTQGSEGLDFQSAGDTCASMTYAAGQTCVVNVLFRPTAPGERVGAIVLLDRDKNRLALRPLLAGATGPIATFIPGLVTTAAGNSSTFFFSGDGGPATSASLFLPFGVAFDAAGTLYIADTINNRVRTVNAAGVITTIAGDGTAGYTGDGGSALNARLNNPSSVQVGPAGDIYIADTGNSVIRVVNATTHIISTFAGNGTAAYAGNGGPATAASLNLPNGIALDAANNLYIADTANNVVRLVNAATRVISTVAGNNAAAYRGDGGPATSANLNAPWSVALTSAGGFLIADQKNNAVRSVSAAGMITTLAGNGTGKPGFAGDGAVATSAQLNTPSGLAIDVAGNTYVSDTGNNRIRKINPSTGIITTIAGSGNSADDYAATRVSLYGPYGLALDSKGNLFIADASHNRVRKVWSNATVLDYPTTRIGSVSAPLNAIIENDGTTTLDLTDIYAVSNAQVDPASTCASTTMLAPLAQCTIAADFAPTVVGTPITGSIMINSNASNANSTLRVRGYAQQTYPTIVLLSSNPNPSIVGNPVVFSVQVVSSGGIVPTGAVTLLDGASTIGSSTLTNGVAMISVSGLAVGQHSITASYAGDVNDSAAVSLALLQIVQPIPANASTTTSLSSSANPASVGQALTLSATVAAAPGQASPTGSVVFQEGSTVLGTGILASGATSINLSTLAVGTHLITAIYSGSANYTTSTSAVLTQVIVPAGQSTNLSFTVTPASLSLKSGAHQTLQIALTTAATYSDTLSFGCAGLPASATCTFSQDQLAVSGGGTKMLTVVVDTGNPLGAGPSAHLAWPDRLAPPPSTEGRNILACMLPAGALLALVLGRYRRRLRGLDLFLGLVLLGTLATLSGCSSTFTVNATTAGAYTFQVVAGGAKTGASFAVPVQLTVTK